MDLNALIDKVAEERNLRESTKYNYRRLLIGAGIEPGMSRDEIESRLLLVRNVNTRRATAVAVRSVLSVKVRLPKGQPRRITLPTEDELRFALMSSKYEVRGLLMAFAGLRLGEACAVTREQLDGDRLLVDRQVLQFHTGLDKDGHGYSVCRIAPTKSFEASVVVPLWLCPMIEALEDYDLPKRVSVSLRKAGKRHGVVLNPHSLRHWYATTLLNRGANIKLVSEQLRHTDVATTLRTYAQTNADDIHKLLG